LFLLPEGTDTAGSGTENPVCGGFILRGKGKSIPLYGKAKEITN